tara:strand:+ start:254 stop:1009 length:756 start_codon:yes stop_codon:yes gene_type:complete
MIFTQQIYDIYDKQRNLNILVYGTNIDKLYKIIHKRTYIQKDYSKNIYYNYESNYIIDLSEFDKKNCVEFLKEVTRSSNYYNENKKQSIIICNIQIQNTILINTIQTIIDTSYLTSVFLLHTTNLNLLSSIKTRYTLFSLPTIPIKDKTNDISYNKIKKLLQTKLTVNTIEEIRDLSYHYYLNHKNSNELQKMLVIMIGNNLYIPNSIKYQFISDIAKLNTIYQYSFRKPIYFESMIISLFKNLKNYTTNL